MKKRVIVLLALGLILVAAAVVVVILVKDGANEKELRGFALAFLDDMTHGRKEDVERRLSELVPNRNLVARMLCGIRSERSQKDLGDVKGPVEKKTIAGKDVLQLRWIPADPKMKEIPMTFVREHGEFRLWGFGDKDIGSWMQEWMWSTPRQEEARVVERATRRINFQCELCGNKFDLAPPEFHKQLKDVDLSKLPPGSRYKADCPKCGNRFCSKMTNDSPENRTSTAPGQMSP